MFFYETIDNLARTYIISSVFLLLNLIFMYNLTIKELAASSKQLEQAKTEADYQRVFNEIYFALVKHNTNYQLLSMAHSFADVSTIVKIIHRSAKDRTRQEVVELIKASANRSVADQQSLLQQLRIDHNRLLKLDQRIKRCGFLQYQAKKRLRNLQKAILSRGYATDIYLAYLKRRYEQTHDGKNFAKAFMSSAANV